MIMSIHWTKKIVWGFDVSTLGNSTHYHFLNLYLCRAHHRDESVLFKYAVNTRYVGFFWLNLRTGKSRSLNLIDTVKSWFSKA